MSITEFKIADYSKVDHMEVATNLILSHFKNQEDLVIFYFGSRVNGNFTRRSDLDVGLWQTDNSQISLLTIGMLREALEDSIVPFKVDFVDFSQTKPAFRQVALKSIQIMKGNAYSLDVLNRM